MATLSTPEEIGLKIMAQFRIEKIGTNEIMIINAPRIIKIKKSLGVEVQEQEINNGIEWLEAKGYVNRQEDKIMPALLLTEVGFAAM